MLTFKTGCAVINKKDFLPAPLVSFKQNKRTDFMKKRTVVYRLVFMLYICFALESLAEARAELETDGCAEQEQRSHVSDL